MSSRSLIRASFRKSLSRAVPFAALALATSFAHTQAVPVPFAGLYAGGGPVCSTSLPVFTVSGAGGAKYGDGCPATQATFNAPVAVATDSYGNVFVADQTNDLIRVIYNGGTALAAAITAANVQNAGIVPQKGYIYTIVGGVTTSPASASTYYCNQAGTGTIAQNRQLNGCPGTQTYVQPRGLGVDADGNVFFGNVGATSSLNVFYVGGAKAAALISTESPSITPQVGYTYSLAGTTASSYTGDGALAFKATLNTPRGIFVDANENVYFADNFNNAIRRIDGTTGFISTVAGHNAGSVSSCSAVTFTGDGNSATATTTSLACPYGAWLDQNGNIFIAEGGNGSSVPGRIRVVYNGGTLPGISAPTVGNIYTYAGGGAGTTSAQLTTFQEVFGVAIDPSGYLYITDYRGTTASTTANKIWRVDPTNGNIAAIAGNSGSAVLTVGAKCSGATGPSNTDKYGDGCPGTQAYLNTPQESVAFDAHGNFYVDDRANNVIRSFTYNNNFPATPVGTSTTQPIAFLYPAGATATAEVLTTQGSGTDYSDAGGDTCSTTVPLTASTTCVDYIKFTPTAAGLRSGNASVTSGTSTTNLPLNGIGTSPLLTVSAPTSVTLGSGLQPLSISVDEIGNVNISDGASKKVLRTTLAGSTPTTLISGLGTPRETTTGPFGTVYVADSTNNNISTATAKFGAGLSAPQGVAADLYGNLYIADTGNNRLVFLSPVTGVQRTVNIPGITLSAPTYLTIDSSGNLYILDTNGTRLLELPLGAAAQTITLPIGATPTAFAFDAGGDLYLADTASGNILFVPTGSTTATNLIVGSKNTSGSPASTPVGVAVDPSGNVFVADSSSTSAAAYNFALNTSTFTTTNITLTSLPITLTLASVGNVSATLSTPTYVETGSASAFPPTTPASCTPALILATGATCTQTFQFSPTVPGSQSAQVIFSDTTGQSTTAKFNAVATNLILTTLTISPIGTTSNYGQTVTYTVTLIPNSTGSSAPSGTVNFLVDGIVNSTTTLGTSPFTFKVSLDVGIHTIAAVYSGDTIYAGSNASTTVTTSKAVTATTASYSQSASGTTLGATVTFGSIGAISPTGNVIFYVDGTQAGTTVPVGNGTVSETVLLADGTHTYYATYVGDPNYATSTSTTQTLTIARAATALAFTITPVSSNGSGALLLTAKVTSQTAGTPTGSVSFTNGATVLGTVTLPASGIATFTTTSTTFTNYTFAAAYSGDGLYSPSSATVSEGPDFVVIAPTAALVVPQGGQAIASFSVAPINGYTGSLTAACSNLPTNAICRFQPIPVSITSTAAVTLSVQVFVGVNPNVATLSHPLSRIAEPFLALLILTPFAFVLRRRKKLPVLLAFGIAILLPFGLTGCGIKTPAFSNVTYTTPIGTTAVTVTLTDTNGVARSAVFNVTVNTQ